LAAPFCNVYKLPLQNEEGPMRNTNNALDR